MVCPRCAKVDAIATSVSSHVDLNEITGQIIESNDTLRTLDKSRMMDGDKKERRFTVSAIAAGSRMHRDN